jgi:hypothetical protein
MADTVNELEAALQPIAEVDANHQSSLIVERRVFSGAAAFEREVAGDRQKEEMAVVGNVVVEGLPPEVGFGFCGDDKLFAGLFRGGWLVEPFHFGEKRLAGELRLGNSRHGGERESLRHR